jgi:hypothetical protein
MALVTFKMHDDPTRFSLQKGDRVAWIRPDGGPDSENQGVVVDGVWQGEEGGGSYRATYEVQRPDGRFFRADELQLTRILVETEIRQKIRERMRSGQLPASLPSPPAGDLEGREPMLIGEGRGKLCSACDLLIPTTDERSLELHYPSGQVVRFHGGCHKLWDDERHQRPGVPGTGQR